MALDPFRLHTRGQETDEIVGLVAVVSVQTVSKVATMLD